MHILRIGAVFVLAAVASGAWAAEVSIGGVAIKLPAPAGFCELSASQPVDNHALTEFGALLETAGGRLLAVSADCRQLADWRAGKRLLDDYAQFQTPIARINQVEPRAFIHKTCASLRAQGDQLISNQAADIKSKLEGAVANVKVNSQEFVGVLAEDDTACYAAQILKARLPNGADESHLILSSLVVVKDKPIFVNRYAVYANAAAKWALLTELKDTVAALYAAN